MEDEGMKITVVGAVLIIAAIAAVISLVRCLQRKAEESAPIQGWMPRR